MYWPVHPPETFSTGVRPGPDTAGRPDEKQDAGRERILAMEVDRTGIVFATISPSTLTVWWARPTSVLTAVIRTSDSVEAYGRNERLAMHPNSIDFVVQTTGGYLLVYSLAIDPSVSVYGRDGLLPARGHGRRQSASRIGLRPAETAPVPSAVLRFRTAIPVSPAITAIVAFDDGVLLSTETGPAVRFVPWPAELAVPADDLFHASTVSFDYQANDEFAADLASFDWLDGVDSGVYVSQITVGRRLKRSIWVLSDGRAAVVRIVGGGVLPRFEGEIVHQPVSGRGQGVCAAVNTCFSLVAIGCDDGAVSVYSVDRLELVRTLSLSAAGFGGRKPVRSLLYAPDGFCLFSGLDDGWALWSPFGRLTSSTAAADQTADPWVRSGILAGWLAGGLQLVVVNQDSMAFSVVRMARSGLIGCYSGPNLDQALLQTDCEVVIHRNFRESADPSSTPRPLSAATTAIAGDTATGPDEGGNINWEIIPAPQSYIEKQWPLRAAVISPDGRYVAVAGRAGLAHLSVPSGRWRMFESGRDEDRFRMRGGMCWFRNFLVIAVEVEAGSDSESDSTVDGPAPAQSSYAVWVFARERALAEDHLVQTIRFDCPIVHLSPAGRGQDGLLVYGRDNVVRHFDVAFTADLELRLTRTVELSLEGAIANPMHVRALTWIPAPDEADVSSATVMFLIADSLVRLVPTVDEDGEAKYEASELARSVEFFGLVSSTNPVMVPDEGDETGSVSARPGLLERSVWVFDGRRLAVWPNQHHLVIPSSVDGERSDAIAGMAGTATPISIDSTGYPVSVRIEQGDVLFAQSSVMQDSTGGFAYATVMCKRVLFIPRVLEHLLARGQVGPAIQFANQYHALPYFALALELLLHDVMHRPDSDVTATTTPTTAAPPSQPHDELVGTVVQFLSSFTHFLDVIAHSLRKSESGSWPTLLRHLPPPRQLFDDAIAQGKLSTAGSFLLVVASTTPDDPSACSSSSPPASSPGLASAHDDSTGTRTGPTPTCLPDAVRLLRLAEYEANWDLCRQLAQFLFALDGSGRILRRALEQVGLAVRSDDRAV